MADYGKKIYGMTEQDLIDEENGLSFSKFTCEMAKILFEKIVEEMEKPKDGFKPMGVEIVLNGMPIYTHYQYGSTQNTIAWIEGKRRTVEYFGLSSACIDVKANMMGIDEFCDKFGIDPYEYKLCGGSFPIIVKELGMVGTVTVSGLSRREDHEICVKTLKFVKGNI